MSATLRVSVLVLALCGTCGCGRSRTISPDAGAHGDAGARSDAGAHSDAGEECIDRDGDGHAAAECGGDDCDDGDPELSPARGHCTGPGTISGCVDGAVEELACAPDTPDCDHRTGRCVAAGDACGDEVVHPSEHCDPPVDGRCDATCRRICAASAACPENAPFCSLYIGQLDWRCAPGNPGGRGLLERCEADAECETGLCDPVRFRCTEFCHPGQPCGGGDHVCAGAPFAYEPNALQTSWPGLYTCAVGCYRPSDCPEGSRCTFIPYRGSSGTTYCERPQGTGPLGSPCTLADDCDSNVCWDGRCTHVCFDDTDCGHPELPRCVEVGGIDPVLRPRPPGWLAPAQVCVAE